MSKTILTKLIRSGGSQVFRIPREFQLPGIVVKLRRRGNVLEPEPIEENTEAAKLWVGLAPLKPLKRAKTRNAEKRKPILKD